MKLINLIYSIIKNPVDYTIDEEKVWIFKQQIENKFPFWKDQIKNVFKRIKFDKKVLMTYINYKKNMDGGRITYQNYRDKIVNTKRIKGGIKFWNQNRKFLNNINKEFGIPPEIIISIIGIETNYGNFLGNWVILNNLYTLAFNNSSKITNNKKNFFTEELMFFLSYCINNKYTINQMFEIKGSFAGAIGLPQFMPSSIKRYAKDGDNDGKIDLFNSHFDIIKSIASYLKKKGWKKHHLIIVSPKKKELVKYKMNKTIKKCKRTYILLDNKKKYIGNNFCILKRYNNSNFYAMAVYDLGEELRRQL